MKPRELSKIENEFMKEGYCRGCPLEHKVKVFSRVRSKDPDTDIDLCIVGSGPCTAEAAAGVAGESALGRYLAEHLEPFIHTHVVLCPYEGSKPPKEAVYRCQSRLLRILTRVRRALIIGDVARHHTLLPPNIEEVRSIPSPKKRSRVDYIINKIKTSRRQPK